MNVELLAHTPDPEGVIAAAARLCYSDSTIADLMAMEEGARTKFLEKILSVGHLSVLEHATFSFGIEGISRACSHQLVRHRIASYSQQSQRYVTHREDLDVRMPDTIAADQALAERFEQMVGQMHGFYQEMVDAGIPAEDARFILPNAATTKLVMTMNGRELVHFFGLRCCYRAQWEIREMATLMLTEARKAAPTIFATAGPGCLKGACPEGKMCCGRADEARAEFSNL